MKNFKRKTNGGFTMIEMIVYLALFGILVGGAIVSVYAMFESQARNQNHAMVTQEGNYILGKIDWAITGATSIDTTQPNQLLIMRNGIPAGENPLIFLVTSGNIYMYRNTISGTAQPLNNSNIIITNLVFTHTLGTGDGLTPESIKASFTINTKTSTGLPYSQDFSLFKYLRK